ncbi:MAG: SBBP repeat-containing protein [Sedimentisphaerales bacterium]
MKKRIFTTIAFILLSPQFLDAAPPVQRWVAGYNGPANGDDFSSAIAIDNLGNVYVTGCSDGNDAVPDYATIKYDSNDIQKWAARYNGPGNLQDCSYAIAVDSSGNVYVTGRSWDINMNYDYATIKYDSNGTQKWVARYNGTGNSNDSAQAITLDNAGNIYVTGTSIGSGTREDYATIKYDSNGNQKWAARYDGPPSSDDDAQAIAVDNSGNVYVTGRSDNSTNSDYATIKYDLNGNQKWAARYDGPPSSDDYAYAIALDSQGNIYVTGKSIGSGTGIDYATIKYDLNGNQKWVARYDGPGNAEDYAQAIVSDSTGNVYVTGSSWDSDTGYDYATIKYDTNGSQKWAARYDGPEHLDDSARAIALDSAGNVYVTGISCSGTGNDYATVKYDPNGNQEWVARHNGPENLDDYDYAPAMAADNLGNVYVTGYSYSSDTGNDYLTIKYTQHNYCTSTAGDLNGNCKVDFADYAILAQGWLAGNDWEDLAILADNWLECSYALQEDCW